MSEVDVNQLYFYEISKYWEQFAIYTEHGTRLLQGYINDESYSNLTELEKSKLVIAHVGTFAGHGVLTLLGMTPGVKGMPSEFPEQLCVGLELKKSPTSLGDIDNYHNRLRKAGLDDVLSWLVNWCYANDVLQ